MKPPSKLKDEAAMYLTEAGYPCNAHQITCVSGYWKKEDCWRWSVFNGYEMGCWLTLTKFVKECRKAGGAVINWDNREVDPK